MSRCESPVKRSPGVLYSGVRAPRNDRRLSRCIQVCSMETTELNVSIESRTWSFWLVLNIKPLGHDCCYCQICCVVGCVLVKKGLHTRDLCFRNFGYMELLLSSSSNLISLIASLSFRRGLYCVPLVGASVTSSVAPNFGCCSPPEGSGRLGQTSCLSLFLRSPRAL